MLPALSRTTGATGPRPSAQYSCMQKEYSTLSVPEVSTLKTTPPPETPP